MLRELKRALEEEVEAAGERPERQGLAPPPGVVSNQRPPPVPPENDGAAVDPELAPDEHEEGDGDGDGDDNDEDEDDDSDDPQLTAYTERSDRGEPSAAGE